MNPETKYKYEILREINPEDNLSDIKACLSFKSNKHIFGGNYFMKKGLVYGLSIAGVLVLAGGVTAGILLNGNNSSKYAASGENSIVTMEVNPSISFSVNDKNIVTAVSGENNEGKMIILEESFKGLPLEEAIEKAITIENDTGYIVSGSVEANENNIKFTVNVDSAKAKELLGNLIEETVSHVSEKLDIDTKLSMLDSYTHEKLVEHILILDPSYNEDELKAKSYEELIDILDDIMLERENFYSTELEEFYSTIKEYEFDMAEQEWAKEVISDIGGVYGVVYNAAIAGINTAISGLNVAIDTLTTLRYNLFVSDTSVYQGVYDTFLSAKEAVLESKNKVANIKDEETKKLANEELDRELETLSKIEAKLDETKEAAIAEIDSSIESINTAIEKVNGIIEELPGQEVIEKALSEKVADHDKFMNDKKNEIIKTFEDDYKDDLLKAKDQFKSFRTDLKTKIRNARG